MQAGIFLIPFLRDEFKTQTTVYFLNFGFFFNVMRTTQKKRRMEEGIVLLTTLLNKMNFTRKLNII